MRSAFQKIYDPRPGELWLLDDNKILMDDTNKKNKGNRLCLILFNCSLSNKTFRHIIPCSTSAITGKFHIPLHGHTTLDKDAKYNLKASSHACVHLYQPLRLDAFARKIGYIDPDFLHFISLTLSSELIGISPLFNV